VIGRLDVLEAFQKGWDTLDSLVDGIPDDGLLSQKHRSSFAVIWVVCCFDSAEGYGRKFIGSISA